MNPFTLANLPGLPRLPSGIGPQDRQFQFHPPKKRGPFPTRKGLRPEPFPTIFFRRYLEFLGRGIHSWHKISAINGIISLSMRITQNHRCLSVSNVRSLFWAVEESFYTAS